VAHTRQKMGELNQLSDALVKEGHGEVSVRIAGPFHPEKGRPPRPFRRLEGPIKPSSGLNHSEIPPVGVLVTCSRLNILTGLLLLEEKTLPS